MTSDFALPIGPKITLPGHFDVPVMLEDARILGSGYECRFRLPDGSLEEALISLDEAATPAESFQASAPATQPVNAEKIRLRVEADRIRLAYAHGRQFAVSISGIQTLSRQIEAF